MNRTVGAAKERVRDAALQRLRGGPRTRGENARFAALVAELGASARGLSASAGWSDVQLTRAIVDLQAAVAEDHADDGRAVDVALGRRPWHDSPSEAWEALLRLSERAVRTDPELALRAATVLVTARPEDQMASAVREDAQRAVRRSRRPDSWRRRAAQRSADDEVAATLSVMAPGEPLVPGWFAVEDALGGGAGLAAATAGELRRAYLGHESAPRAYLPTLRNVLARGLTDDLPLAGLNPLLDSTAQMFHGPDRRDLSGIETVNISGLREFLSGKSVCLVANSADLLEHELGAQIDSFDVVVRFNSFAIDAVHTGRKTDVHATIHLHDFNWDVPVDVRIVFGGLPGAWSENIRRHVHPGAQRLLGDDSLRWPRRSLLPADLRERCTVPTSGFNMLLLLDYLDVSTRIDLFGFNFHAGRPFRRDDAMHLPVAAAHSYDVERDWVAARTVSTSPGRISLR